MFVPLVISTAGEKFCFLRVRIPHPDKSGIYPEYPRGHYRDASRKDIYSAKAPVSIHSFLRMVQKSSAKPLITYS